MDVRGARFRYASELARVGDEARIAPHLHDHPPLAERARIVHTDAVVEMQDKPSQAVRRGRSSSMWLALDCVRKGEADVMVSAGNTGALMAMAKLVLTTMPGIERPAIAGLWPTISGTCIVLDLGANVGATARQLADFALMGAAMARAVLQVAHAQAVRAVGRRLPLDLPTVIDGLQCAGLAEHVAGRVAQPQDG